MYAHLHKLSVDFTVPRQASSIRPAGPTPSPGREQNGITQGPLHPRRGQPALPLPPPPKAPGVAARRRSAGSGSSPPMIRLPTNSTFPHTCVTPLCKSGTKSRMSPQHDSRPDQLSLHQDADIFRCPHASRAPTASRCRELRRAEAIRLSRSWRFGCRVRGRGLCRCAILAFAPWRALLQPRRGMARLRFSAAEGPIANS